MRTRYLLPSAARKLAGKLSWGATAVFGRGARVYLAPLFFHASQYLCRVPRRLQESLEWWLRFLEAVPRRIVPYSPCQPAVLTLYADAAGGGQLAWVAHIGSCRRFASAEVPPSLRQWVLRRRSQIATWELVAALCAVWHFLADSVLNSATLQINLFIDSNVALGTLLRGSSRQRDWNELVKGIWFETARRAALLLAWRVPSKQNVADIPTRTSRCKDLESLRNRGFVEVEWIWPPTLPWSAASL